MNNDPEPVEAIQTWLRTSYSVQVPPDWLSACVEWIQQENGVEQSGQLLPVAQLQPMVFEQWLMSDLRELGTTCLPADLPAQLCTDVSGPLALQVDSMLDVGAPLYGQLQKVKGTSNANSEISADKPQQPAWEPKPSRMMLLKMTDGQTEVQGMEYRPIPALNSDLQPGFKVVIYGQVKCRRGVLMLTADNVQVLGGEVDSLIEANTPVAVLERAMEESLANNGKHSRKEFSGRFIKKQDYTSGCQDLQEKKFKTEVTWSLQRPALTRGQFGGHLAGNENCRGDGVKKELQSQMCAWNSNGVKQEPLSQPPTLDHDDEWEEDLDYGELLDEPMEEDLGAVTEPPASPQDHGGALRKNPFACASSSAAANAPKSWQEQDSGDRETSQWDSSGQQSGLRTGENEVTGRPPVRTQQSPSFADTVSKQIDQRQKIKPTSLLQSDKSAVVDDSMWGDDDDDFDFTQVETDILSPVIPVQTPLGQNRQNTNSVDAGTSRLSGMLIKSHSFPSTSTNKPDVTPVFGSSTAVTAVSSSLKGVPIPQSAAKTTVPPKPPKSSENIKPPPPKQRKLTAMFSRTTKTVGDPAVSSTVSQRQPAAVVDLTHQPAAVVDLKHQPAAVVDLKHQPAAVVDLTRQPAAVVDLTRQPAAVVDLTEGDMSPLQNAPGNSPTVKDVTGVKLKTHFKADITHRSQENVSFRSQENVLLRSQENVSLRSQENVSLRSEETVSDRSQEDVSLRSKENVLLRSQENESLRSEETVSDRSQEDVSMAAGRAECQDVDMAEEGDVREDDQTARGSQRETVPQAVVPPLNTQGEPVSPEPQTLKSALAALQSEADSELCFTIKGYITTLTDRLRSCQGEQWTLSCRVTDGTAALDVTIADEVLAQLIGFTAQKSISLRQQARKDTSVKDFLTQGLQNCQKYLIEFSGLLDIQRGKGDSKPSLVKMIKLETKVR